jgi:hypothetical protein
MGQEDGVDGAVGGDGDAVDDGEVGLAEGFEDGDEGYVDIAGGEEIGEAGGMLEDDVTIVGDDEGFCVEVLDAADSQGMEGGKWAH